ncbi:MAG: glycosyltransferase [Eubacteriales bacterium]|nr:glycosyltransferase [Eubacteriales bacterium]
MDHWSNGGEESYIMDLLRHWDLATVECEILTAQVETDRYHAELSALGVPLDTVLDLPIANPISRVWKTCLSIGRVMAARKYDVVYFQMANAVTLFYCHLAKRAGIPVRAVHSHCAGLIKSRGYFVKRLAHEISKQLFASTPTVRMACSGTAAEWLYPKRKLVSCHMIPNGINVSGFRFSAAAREAVRDKLGISTRFVLGTVGRCEEQKNQSFLITLMADLKDTLPNAVLLLVGEGSLLDGMKAEAAEKGVQDRIIFYGASSDVPSLLSAMDVFLLPSLFEGNPISSVEAQANGLPCYLSDTITPQAKLTDHLDFLPIHQGPQAWTDAVIRAYRNPQRYPDAADQLKAQACDSDIAAKHVWELVVSNPAKTL